MKAQPPLLAVDTEQAIEGFLTPTGTERTHVEEAIGKAFVAAESRLVDSSDEPGRREAFSRMMRQKPPITIRALVRSVGDVTPLVYHFEAVRQARSDQGVYGVVVDGWAVRTDNVIAPYGVKAHHFWGDANEDAAGGPVLSAMGLIRLDHQVFWVSRLQGYEEYSYVIDRVEPRSTRRVLQVTTGGC